MNKLILTILSFMVLANANAKTVKFSVDMTGVIISSTGVHVAGDFQTLAGYSGGDWQSNTTIMTQEGTTDIYSVVVNIPAFAKYEYKFLSGDQWYESEFVPVESRVENPNNDNRWIFIDSLDTDTFHVPTVVFGTNSITGKKLVRFRIDMNLSTVSANGVHLAGDFQSWNSTEIRLCDIISNGVYEYQAYLDSNSSIEYLFYNGNQTADAEQITGSCATNGKRSLTVFNDTIIELNCFGYCITCSSVGIASSENIKPELMAFPNPADEFATLEFSNDFTSKTIILQDLSGKSQRTLQTTDKQVVINKENLTSGIYIVLVRENDVLFTPFKLMFN